MALNLVSTIPEEDRYFLSLLQEECSEIIQICSKIYRFGLDSYHPADVNQVTNHELLTQEIGDVLAIVLLLIKRGQVNVDEIDAAVIRKIKKLETFGITA